MIFGISVNTSKINYEVILKKIWVTLKNIIPNCAIKIFLDGQSLENEKHTLSFLFIIGGDGTILGNVRILKDHQIPIIGVNYGTLGFMASIEVKDIEKSVEFIKEGNYYLENRIMIDSQLNVNDTVNHYIALNDVVVMKLPMSKLLKFNIYIDDIYYNTFSGDGLIISTPTGSTAYSLSAGGPIVSPNIESFIITPICPHSLNAKSIVISSESTVKLEINGIDDNCFFVVDGQKQEVVLGKQFIKVCKYKKSCSIVRFDFYDYYYVLREKLINRI